jgi:hypothetical protein
MDWVVTAEINFEFNNWKLQCTKISIGYITYIGNLYITWG